MASKGQLKLLTDFLNIPDVKVTHFIQDPSLGFRNLDNFELRCLLSFQD